MSIQFDLPRGYAGDGVVHKTVTMREMTGEEEDVLSQRKLSMAKRMQKVLVSCTEKLGEITEKTALDTAIKELAVGDRVRLLLGLRVASLGGDYSFEILCGQCDNRFNGHVDLDSLDVTTGSSADQNTFEAVLPGSGKKVKFHPMTGADEEKMSTSKLAKESALSASIMARVTEVDGEAVTVQVIKKLSMRDRNYLRRRFEEIEGGVETDIEVSCPKCDTEFKTMVDIGQPGFFFPKE